MECDASFGCFKVGEAAAVGAPTPQQDVEAVAPARSFRFVDIRHGKPEMEDTGPIAFEEVTLRSFTVAGCTQLDLHAVEVGVAVGQCLKVCGRNADVAEDTQRRERLPRSDPHRLVKPLSGVNVGDHDADVVKVGER